MKCNEELRLKPLEQVKLTGVDPALPSVWFSENLLLLPYCLSTYIAQIKLGYLEGMVWILILPNSLFECMPLNVLSIRRTGEGIDSPGFQLNTKTFRKFWGKALCRWSSDRCFENKRIFGQDSWCFKHHTCNSCHNLYKLHKVPNRNFGLAIHCIQDF